MRKRYAFKRRSSKLAVLSPEGCAAPRRINPVQLRWPTFNPQMSIRYRTLRSAVSLYVRRFGPPCFWETRIFGVTDTSII